jgi:hypothetical protein
MTAGNDHTYLFKQGLWRADGEYFDAAGNAYPVEGEFRITHANDLWINESRMRIVGNGNTVFRNDYRITPFCEERDFTCWSADNDALGKLTGRLVRAGDAILSLYRSEDSEYAGTESWLRISGILYRNWGTLFHGNDRLSSWMIRLNRV